MVAESIRWETMDKVERKAEGFGGKAGWQQARLERGVWGWGVTALISSRSRRGPGWKQKAIRHQTFKLENSPAGPFAGWITYSPPPSRPLRFSSLKHPSNPLRFRRPRRSPLDLRILLFAKPHTIPAVASLGLAFKLQPTFAESRPTIFKARKSPRYASTAFVSATELPLPGGTCTYLLAVRAKRILCSASWLAVLKQGTRSAIKQPATSRFGFEYRENTCEDTLRITSRIFGKSEIINGLPRCRWRRKKDDDRREMVVKHS